VLKKAAIIVAGSAAAILAAAPLALAHGYDHSPKCDFAKQKAANAVSQPATGVTAPLLGALGLAVPVAIPVNANVQAPILSCNNVEDVLNPRIDHNLNHNDL
jgi:hypothetical protein